MVRQQTPQVPIPEPPPRTGRIAWWIENTLVRVGKFWYRALGDPIRDLLHFSLSDWLEEQERELLAMGGEAIDYLLAQPGIPQPIKNVLGRFRRPSSPAAALALVPIFMAVMMPAIGKILNVVFEPFAQAAHTVIRATLLDPSTLVVMWKRGIISEGILHNVLARQGIDDLGINALKTLSQPLIEEDELTQGWWRGIIGENVVNQQLKGRGYSDYMIAVWKQVRKLIPSPAELVAIATREGFDDAVAGQFGYDENFPAQAADAAEKGGLPSEWFRRLWRAHWRLPGINQGFEMFQRRIITLDQLRLLMRASDIPSFWRESLIKLSYSTITRVDVRRMYDLGVLSEEEVYQRNLDLGYTPADALKLTQWTVAQYVEADRELTKTDILGMYRDGVLTEAEATTYLDALGYRADNVSLLLAREDLKRERKYESEVESGVHDLYVTKVIDRTDVWARLGKLNPPSGYISNLLEIWDLERIRRTVRPTKTELRDMWLLGIIPEPDLNFELSVKGYSDKYVGWLKQLWEAG